jgi:SSS family solute:Na+ symporter
MTGFVVFVGYLIALLAIGLGSQRLMRGTGADFFTASASIGPFMLLMSLFGATMTSFAIVGSTAESYERGIGVYGLMASWAGIVHPLMFVFVGVPVWRIGQRYGFVTQVQLLRDRYASEALGWLLVPILAGLVVPYLLIALQSAGMTVAAVTKGAFPTVFVDAAGQPSGIPPAITGAALTLVTLIYINTGGLRAAAWANALQTGVFVAVAAFTFVVIAIKLGGPAAAMAKTASLHPERLVRAGNIGQGEFLSYGLVGLSVGMFPHIFQHWLSARSADSFKLTAVAHPLLVMSVWLPCVFIGTWAAGELNVPPEQSGKVLGMMVAKFSDPVLGAVLTAGVVAAIMSSLDSQFLALGTIATEDVLLRLRPTSDPKTVVWTGRLATFGVAALTWLLAQFSDRGVFELGVWCFSGFTGLLPVILGAVYWRRATAAGAIACVITAVATWIALFAQSRAGGGGEAFLVGGVMPVTWILGASSVAMVGVSLATEPPPSSVLDRYFPDAREPS